MSGPVRLLIISHSCVLPINRRVYEVLARESDFAIHLLLPSHYTSDFDGRRIHLAEREVPGIETSVGRTILTGHGSSYVYLSGLRRAIREFRPDVLFLDEEPWSLAALQALMCLRRRETRLAFYTKQNLRLGLPPPFRQIQSWAFRRTALAFAISQEAVEILRWKGYAGPVEILPHGVDVKSFLPSGGSQIRTQEGLRGFVFGYYGRLVPEKGVRDFVEAALRFLAGKERRVATFFIVGSGPEREWLARRVGATPWADHFVFREKVSHDAVGEALAASDVVVVPSRTVPRWKEQFGRVIIEALACGVPVIGSDSGEIPVLIEKTGGGLTFPESDSEAFAERMEALWRDPALRQDLAEKGRSSVLANYSLEAVAAQLREALLKAAGRSR
jgi:glycosyltransferase involved in cell wall biosynthesis